MPFNTSPIKQLVGFLHSFVYYLSERVSEYDFMPHQQYCSYWANHSKYFFSVITVGRQNVGGKPAVLQVFDTYKPRTLTTPNVGLEPTNTGSWHTWGTQLCIAYCSNAWDWVTREPPTYKLRQNKSEISSFQILTTGKNSLLKSITIHFWKLLISVRIAII